MADAAELDGKTLKKKKSVMGRLKSKISHTLGRKKSLTDMSPTDKDLKKPTSTDVDAAIVHRSSEPELGSSRDDGIVSVDSQQQQREDERIHGPKYPHAAIVQAKIEPFDAKLVDDDYVDDDDDDNDNESNGMNSGGGSNEEKPPAPGAPLEQEEQQQQEQDEEVFASDYKSGATARNDYSDDDDDDDDDEEKLEVFAEDGGNQHSSRDSLRLPQQQEPETVAEPDSMDLVVVGLSPLKLSRAAPPQLPSPVKKAAVPASLIEEVAMSLPQPSSPMKKAAVPALPVAVAQPVMSSPRASLQPAAAPQPVPEEKEHEEQSFQPKRRGGIKVDLQQDDSMGDSASGAPERPMLKAAPQFSSSRSGATASKKSERLATIASPEKPSSSQQQQQTQPLLSDFHFGSELASAATRSTAADSPAKRRGAITSSALSSSVSAAALRKSFAREQEQHLAMPSPSKKAMTRSSVSKSAAVATSEQPRKTLQGIQEETKRLSSPRKAAVSRRRSSSMMEAPILASSFIASSPDDPASHDEPPQQQQQRGVDEHDDDDAKEVHDSVDSATTFAFDSGAAITHEFGERVARLLGADPWGDRQDGFDAIQYIVKKADLATAKNKRELFCAAVAAIQGGVEDRVAPVMYCALECLRTLLKEFSPVVDRTFLRYPPANEQLSALVKSLVGKLGDSNKRTQRETSQALLRVAKQKKLKTLPHVLLHLSAKEVAPRLQVDTLRQLVSALGVDSKNGLSLGVVMQFAMPALKVADEKTRKAAVELIADLYMLNGEAVNAQLAGIKPEMLRVINRRVDELLAKREKEKEEQAVQSANQNEEAAGGEDDLERGAELVTVPAEEAKKTVALLEAQLMQAAGVIGPVAWRKLESKTWSDRKEALVDIEKAMAEAKSDLRDARPAFGSVIQLNFLAYCVTVHKCLGDSIAPVVNSAMDGFSTLIKVFGPCVEWREESVRDVVLLTIMRLFSTMQKPNSRTNRAACRSILKFARLTNAHTLRYTLSCIFAKETDALVQMHLLRLLIPEFGFQPDGISAALVLAAVGAALVHANEKVRKTAIDVALCTQRLVGKEYVLKKLKDVKPVTLKELEKNFVDCDAKKESDRPQTVHMSSSSTGDAGLPPVNFGGGENARRLLSSAPVGVGKLHCTPPQDDDEFGSSSSLRRGSVLSNEEENFMDSILDGDL